MIFALDVGTRKIAGIIAAREGSLLRVVDVETVEHETRAMFDGQVHDVEEVARSVATVKKTLEERNETNLREVAVALAGRYLKTIFAEAERDLSKLVRITKEDVARLEMEAVNEAQKKMEEDYFCVGYSVVEYNLDGFWVKRLEGHRGGRAYVRVVSAFLPVQVVEALFKVLELVGLTPVFMTLEPIAAMNVAVPEDLRYLNVALVDVGAGTSDIAISRDGAVVAYSMIPLAGDEITEAIGRSFLLDFNTAERVKRTVFETGKLTVKNILDKLVELDADQVRSAVESTLDLVTGEIARQIMELNGLAPSAVLIVGGGAKVPGFSEKLAEKLGLPAERVSLKTVESTGVVEDPTGRVKGSEFVTPVGIAYSALQSSGSVFSQLYVNGIPVRMMGTNGRYTVMQALIQAGYKFSNLFKKDVLVVEVNGRPVVSTRARGKVDVLVNGEPADFHAHVKHGDRIEVIVQDHQEQLKVKDLVAPIRVTFPDGGKEEVYPTITKNEKEAFPEELVEDGDVLSFREEMSVKELKEKLKSGTGKVVVNGETKTVRLVEYEFFRGETKLFDEDRVKLGEEIVAVEVKRKSVEEALDIPTITVSFNGVQRKFPLMKLKETGENCFELQEFKPMILDLLKDVEVDGLKGYEILRNGKKARFTEELQDGDVVEFIVKKK